MANGVVGLLDLSVVTDALKASLTTAVNDSPLWDEGAEKFDVDVNPAAPDSTRGGTSGACILSLYLFRVEPDRFQRNTQQAPRPQVKFQPAALDLYYLVSAWSGDQYVKEQRAMSIALRWLHQNPIVRMGGEHAFTVTLETGTGDELSHLWQAITAPARLAVIAKASVVFIAPDAPPDSAKPVAAGGVNVEVHQ